MKAEPKGLYQKYNISKSDGTPVDPEARYIVLRIDNSGADTVAKQTMRYAGRRGVQKFAFEIEPVEPELASDIRMMLKLYEIPEAEYAHWWRCRMKAETKYLWAFLNHWAEGCSPGLKRAKEELTRIEELAAKGLRAEQAEREIEAEIERLNSQLHEHYDYGTSRAVGAFRFALDRLKGVE